MGAFVGLFNAVAFRLEAPPYDLSAGVAALVFLVYLAGSAASDAAGRLADRLGRRPVVTAGALVMAAGIGLTAAAPLPLVVAGLTVATAGFFAAHAVASAWVPARARIGPAQAASLYLFAYYAGSSLFGPLASLTWSRGRWPAVSALLLALVLAAAALALVAGRHRDAADAPSASAAGRARR
jgi:YNFM family putative membrane transporter